MTGGYLQRKGNIRERFLQPVLVFTVHEQLMQVRNQPARRRANGR
jgi:hypothetical protein